MRYRLTSSVSCADSIVLSVIQGGEAGKGRKNYHLVYNHWTRVARTMNWEQALGAFRDSLDESRAFLAKEHILLNCLRAEAEGKSVVLCPTPQIRGQILEAYPESESWIDALSLYDSSPVVLIVDEATSEFSQTLTPGQAALELVRHSGSARNQPRQVLDEMSKLAHRIRMYRVPANQSRADYETFLRGRAIDG